ncbi:MAG: sigma-70 family RNA polymerase sigma factor [Candidatus Margulisbacteria bacterium]|jgi:RNA polymerase sigma factor (sigma-70 family)|nr:sigma-70 family RNA polymerase sigma factor [Candidatus Margulisiibacteriota bacterium]
MTEAARVEEIWKKVKKTVDKDIKKHLTEKYSDQILKKYNNKINYLINKYFSSLPTHVVNTEGDDIANVARIEFFETIKVWDPERNEDVWPLAYSRISGAMRDQIRYITKASPTRLYNWVTDASNIYLAVEQDNSFENKIESGVVLNEAMQKLDRKEKFIIISRFKHDKTFKEIGEAIGISESQTTRIYKQVIEKLRKLIAEKGVFKSFSPT